MRPRRAARRSRGWSALTWSRSNCPSAPPRNRRLSRRHQGRLHYGGRPAFLGTLDLFPNSGNRPMMSLAAVRVTKHVVVGGRDNLGKLKVLIADDHPLMVSGVRGALQGESDIEIVAEATSGAQVLPLVGHTKPDLVLLDVRMPELDGLTCLKRIRERYPEVRVVMLSVASDQALISQALEQGACAYIVKSIDTGDLASAIRQTVSGTFFCLGNLGVAQTEHSANGNEAGLSEREVEILQAVARGLSNRAIAKELWLSDQTVKFHLHNIYRKLGVANRTEATKYAFENGLAEAPSLAAVPLQ
ncbi:MAG: hypothetical protein C5B48_10425 [Candidatus Rokuibacteriota bacterium]|nr:MAG: hypothetical protein C5B48_10425 [Candidatus Rokubacteria bacterium]